MEKTLEVKAPLFTRLTKKGVFPDSAFAGKPRPKRPAFGYNVARERQKFNFNPSLVETYPGTETIGFLVHGAKALTGNRQTGNGDGIGGDLVSQSLSANQAHERERHPYHSSGSRTVLIFDGELGSSRSNSI